MGLTYPVPMYGILIYFISVTYVSVDMDIFDFFVFVRSKAGMASVGRDATQSQKAI